MTDIEKMTTEEVLEYLGFSNENTADYWEYLNEDKNQKIHLKGDGIYAYSVYRGSAYEDNDGYLEMHINFIPKSDVLVYLLKKVFYLDI